MQKTQVKKKLGKILDINKNSVYINKDNIIVFEEIEVNGELNVKPIGSAKMEDIYEAFKSKPPGVFECFLPNKNVLGIRTEKNGEITTHHVLLQYDPRIRNIKHEKYVEECDDDGDYYETKEIKEYKIPVPWNVFIIKVSEIMGQFSIDAGWVFFTKEPIKDLKTTLYGVPLNNVYTDGTICWGDNPLEYNPENSIADFAERAVELFWNSYFNEDYDESRHHFTTRGTYYYNVWEKNTLENVVKEPFRESSKKLSHFFNSFGQIKCETQ